MFLTDNFMFFSCNLLHLCQSTLIKFLERKKNLFLFLMEFQVFGHLQAFHEFWWCFEIQLWKLIEISVNLCVVAWLYRSKCMKHECFLCLLSSQSRIVFKPNMFHPSSAIYHTISVFKNKLRVFSFAKLSFSNSSKYGSQF